MVQWCNATAEDGGRKKTNGGKMVSKVIRKSEIQSLFI